jgi:putative nucleotidyltransferase with HDIG domain
LSLTGACAGLFWFAASADGDLGSSLFVVLAGTAALSGLLSTAVVGRLAISATFAVAMLAAAFLGPAAAFAVAITGELADWMVHRYPIRSVVMNIGGVGLPALASGAVFPSHVEQTSAEFAVAIALVGVGALALNFLLIAGMMGVRDACPWRVALKFPVELLPAQGLNIVLAVALAEFYVQSGLAAMTFAALVVVAFSYMYKLVIQARERARAYAALSWGVLSGLVRTLDERDPRAARHGAAVARFSRDIAIQRGLSDQEQELAQTAGLLHDIGRFALSDRVMERGATLTDPDWQTIRRHPTIGADLLRDVGLYGPVAKIVRAHHERWDGRGYPDGLEGEEIPEIARIVAVAEVYDTLTAPDTYRTPMNSFEALNELRRVAGRQLDADVVESLASVLAGRGTDYRHADAADYDAELDLLRRVDEAARG